MGAMHNSIQNDLEKSCTVNSIPSSQSRHEVCSQGQVEKGPLGSNIPPHKKKVSTSFVEPDNLKILYCFLPNSFFLNKMKIVYHHYKTHNKRAYWKVREGHCEM